MAVGWHYERDNPLLQHPENATWQLCHDLITGNGFPPEMTYFCSALLFLDAGLDRAVEVSPEGLRAAVDQLGSTPYSAHNTGTAWSPNRYDGPAEAQLMRFNADCPCFEYVGERFPIP